jgi:hypothetical protein
MKSPTLKSVAVHCAKRKEVFEVDNALFDNVHLEAATRLIEKHWRDPHFNLTAGILCYDMAEGKIASKAVTCNAYFVCVNAGLYEQAERVRETCKGMLHIDLKTFQPSYS